MASTKLMTETQEIKGIVRLIDKDIDGHMPLQHALTQGKGISFMFSHAVCTVLKLDGSKLVGYCAPEEIKQIEDCVRNPAKYSIPAWLFNRRKDKETGENRHVVSSDLDLSKKFDIRFMQKIKSYRGLRHATGAKKVRGQRTKSTGRKTKSLGVKRKKVSGKK